MQYLIKFVRGMKEPQMGDIVYVPTDTPIKMYYKRWKSPSIQKAGRGHTIQVLKVVPNECVLTTSGIGTIKEVSLYDIYVDKIRI